jgi:hypothetical protein
MNDHEVRTARSVKNEKEDEEIDDIINELQAS